jgi:hypothetical protein
MIVLFISLFLIPYNLLFGNKNNEPTRVKIEGTTDVNVNQ